MRGPDLPPPLAFGCSEAAPLEAAAASSERACWGGSWVVPAIQVGRVGWRLPAERGSPAFLGLHWGSWEAVELWSGLPRRLLWSFNSGSWSSYLNFPRHRIQRLKLSFPVATSPSKNIHQLFTVSIPTTYLRVFLVLLKPNSVVMRLTVVQILIEFA